MAKKTPKYDKYIDINWVDLNKMNAQTLRETIKQLSPIANRRLNQLASSEIGQMSPAYQSVIERDKAKFGTRGISKTDINKLRQEYSDINRFITSKTGTLGKFNKVRKDFFKKIAPELKGETPFANNDQEKEFWRVYRKVAETGVEEYSSTQIQKDIRNIYSNANETLREINSIRISEYNARYLFEDLGLTYDDISSSEEATDDELAESLINYLVDNNKYLNEQLKIEDFEISEEDYVNLMVNKLGAQYEQGLQKASGKTSFGGNI